MENYLAYNVIHGGVVASIVGRSYSTLVADLIALIAFYFIVSVK